MVENGGSGNPENKVGKIDPNLAGATQNEQIKQMVLANFGESYGYLKGSGYITDWQEYNDLYRAVPQAKPHDWMSNKFIPFTTSKVDTGLANIMGMIYQVDPPLEVKPRPFGKGDLHHAGLIKTLLAKQISDNNFFYKLVQFVKGLLIYGTMWVKIGWNNQIKKKKYKQKMWRRIINFMNVDITETIPQFRRQFLGYGQQGENVEVEDGPVLDICNIGDVFPDPLLIDVNDGWIVFRRKRTIGYLRQNIKSQKSPRGFYNNEVMNLTAGDGYESKDGKYEIEQNLGAQMDSPVTRPLLGVNVEVLEWHGDYDINGDGELEKCVLELAAGKYVIRKEETPFWHNENPFAKGVYIPLINEAYGMGVPELMRDLQHTSNENFNQRNDNITLSLNPISKYRKSSGTKRKHIIVKPGARIGVDDMDDIEWDRPPDITGTSFAHQADLERWMQEVTAITKLTLAMGGGKDIGATATTSAILQQNASTRFMIMAKIIEHTAFNRIIKMFYELDYQMYDEYKIAAIVGCDPREIDMEKMRPDYYEFVPAGIRTVEDMNQKALKLLQFMNIAKDNPAFKFDAALKKFYTLLRIGDDPNELVHTPEEIQQIMAQRRQQQILQMLMEAQIKGQAGGSKGPEGTQFQQGNIGGTPGVPPPTTPNAPDQNLGPTETKV